MKPCPRCGEPTFVFLRLFQPDGSWICRLCEHPERFKLLAGGADPEQVIDLLLERIRVLEARIVELEAVSRPPPR